MRETDGDPPLMSDVIDSVRSTALKAEARLRQRGGARYAAFAEIAIEFQCRMSPYWNEHRQSADARLYLGRPRFPWLDRRALHHVRIVCRRADTWEPRLYVNGNCETSAAAVAGRSNSNKEGERA